MTILAFASVPLSETQKRLDPLCQLQCSDKCQGAWLKHLLLAGRLAICQEIQFGVPLAWGWHKTQGSTMADWMQTKTSNAELPSTYEAGQIFVHPCPPNETVHHNHVEIRLLPVSHHNHISSVCVLFFLPFLMTGYCWDFGIPSFLQSCHGSHPPKRYSHSWWPRQMKRSPPSNSQGNTKIWREKQKPTIFTHPMRPCLAHNI